MKAKDAKQIVEDLNGTLYPEIETEVLKHLDVYVEADSSGMVTLSFHSATDLREVSRLSLFQIIKRSVSESDDSRNQTELADGLECIAEWLRKDAKRLKTGTD